MSDAASDAGDEGSEGPDGLRDWTVGGAVIEGPAGVLLVRNHRSGGVVDWSPPGGVIDPGEELIEGLTREVAEETGLVVPRWRGPLYEITCRAPQLGWCLRVVAFGAEYPGGELSFNDPDGIVESGDFFHRTACDEPLAGSPQWVREPLVDYLAHRWAEPRRYAYLIEGTRRSELRVTRSEHR
ncbi:MULTISPECIES: NUDIX hydrolase [Candidatus Microthrix]|uniref:NUDIX hydrolase n=1 Tax=Candidatus Neomicrothrix TaxID=41949 RepID=UPI00037EBB4F|nr:MULTISPECIES: NUDIX hydrolase [Microthrix]NLH68017.1 NUDIX hydrolase [Candidatus Microthrix parvicella]MBK6502479.1 NUDIX hydrolase [Candidatus Microthrix sp.]MBK7020173.1 NUDIX hydrolase [Candidatus Microthrix sp.]MBK7323863.1 NUDIX hydrolase [Candidatus Microthrix sp.]MBL0202991.1 NUDIX hydrolase [Candidatus Microthrix sp.]